MEYKVCSEIEYKKKKKNISFHEIHRRDSRRTTAYYKNDTRKETINTATDLYLREHGETVTRSREIFRATINPRIKRVICAKTLS